MFDPQADGAAFRSKYGLDGKFVVSYAGAHGISNDLGVVLQAAAELRDCPEVTFVLVGDGKEKANLQARAQALGLSNLIFSPPVSKTEMTDVLAGSDACVAILMPLELYKTTYPNKVFDYMAAGRPVVLAIDGVIRQVVEQANAGLFAAPGDAHALAEAVRALNADRAAARQMGMDGRRSIETSFNRAALAEQLALILEDMRRIDG